MSVSGSGAVTSDPAGISCPGTCAAQFDSGTGVTLTRTAAGGGAFSSWGASCAGTASTCALTMNAAKTATATFLPLFTLTVSVSGNGTVTSDSGGISCPGTCSAQYISGTGVSLSAAPVAGASLSDWSGACAGGSCSVTMSGDQSATASFIGPETFTLRASSSGSGEPTGQAGFTIAANADMYFAADIAPSLVAHTYLLHLHSPDGNHFTQTSSFQSGSITGGLRHWFTSPLQGSDIATLAIVGTWSAILYVDGVPNVTVPFTIGS